MKQNRLIRVVLGVVAVLILYPVLAIAVSAADGGSKPQLIDVREVGSELTSDQVAQFWARTETASAKLDGQARSAGVVVVNSTTSLSRYEKQVFFAITELIPEGAIMGFSIGLPTGETNRLGVFQFPTQLSPGSVFTLWDGGFGYFWPSGVSEFRVFIERPDGSVAYSYASVSIYAADMSTVPGITNVVQNGDKITITGKFDPTMEIRVVVDWIPIAFEDLKVTKDKITFLRSDETRLLYLPTGERRITVSQNGSAVTRAFYFYQ